MIGIYCITNTVNGKKYIGQSWDIEHRWRKYGRNSHNSHLEKSIKKYGINNFKFEILRSFTDSGLTQILLNLFEDKYIQEYKTTNPEYGYNKRDGGGDGKLSDETKKRISQTLKGRPSALVGYKQTLEHIEHSRLGNIGKVTSEETKRKIAAKLKGRVSPMKGKKQSPEHTRKIREANAKTLAAKKAKACP